MFNAARQVAFNAAGRAVTGDVPAATGIGLDPAPMPGGRPGAPFELPRSRCAPGGAPLRLQIINASRLRAIPIENPRQVSAFHYPSQHGEESDLARAVVMPLVDGPLLLISGTASIVGHETVHHGDVVAQTHEIFANLSALIAAANERVGKDAFARQARVPTMSVRRVTSKRSVQSSIHISVQRCASMPCTTASDRPIPSVL